MPASLGPIDQLIPQQQDDLFDLLTTHSIKEVLAKVNAPSPEGWGLYISATFLVRFLYRREIQLACEERQEQSEHSSEELLEHAFRSVIQKAHLKCLAPKGEEKTARQGFKWLEAIEKLRLERERIKLQKKKIHLMKVKQMTEHIKIAIDLGSSMTHSEFFKVKRNLFNFFDPKTLDPIDEKEKKPAAPEDQPKNTDQNAGKTQFPPEQNTVAAQQGTPNPEKTQLDKTTAPQTPQQAPTQGDPTHPQPAQITEFPRQDAQSIPSNSNTATPTWSQHTNTPAAATA